MIEVKNLVKRYGDLLALDHFNLSVKDGEIFGLLGPNGSGKSTAINCMLALLKYEQGEINLFGEPMTPTSYEIKRKLTIFYDQKRDILDTAYALKNYYKRDEEVMSA